MTRQTDNLLETQAKEILKKKLSGITDVQDSQLNLLINLFELVTFKKNHEIIKEGEIAEYFYFIFKGIIKVYFYKNDKPVVERFEQEGGLFGGNFTHLTKKPGTHIYESIEDVVLLRIKYAELDDLCKKYHEIERLYRVSMEIFHTGYVERLSSFKSLSSEERYHEFVQQYGNITNRVPLKDIANYLDMTPETLSRIRSKYDKY
ncbi:MAG TPA: Crp/Fnr family transcriptional regulator [Chitinophagales bacterium]|nr:Crp/Fnr family transcriptional regulator [Chitinophagales bacterium]